MKNKNQSIIKKKELTQFMNDISLLQQKTKSKPNAVGLIWKGKTTPSVDLTPPAAADDPMVYVSYVTTELKPSAVGSIRKRKKE